MSIISISNVCHLMTTWFIRLSVTMRGLRCVVNVGCSRLKVRERLCVCAKTHLASYSELNQYAPAVMVWLIRGISVNCPFPPSDMHSNMSIYRALSIQHWKDRQQSLCRNMQRTQNTNRNGLRRDLMSSWLQMAAFIWGKRILNGDLK